MVPPNPKIYHVTHVQNLKGIIAAGQLFSEAEILNDNVPHKNVGMSAVKKRRLAIPISCCVGLRVGGCVPFNFCPRSFFLYIQYKGNHPDLAYREGQEPLVHLQADLREVVRWARTWRRAWAISTANAAAGYAGFYGQISDLNKIDRDAVNSNDFRKPEVQEGKQAEFLLQSSFPWSLVEAIGVHSENIQQTVNKEIIASSHKPPVVVRREWYC